MSRWILGPCEWNGNEIVQVSEPTVAVAGLAPDAPEEWGPILAAAPEMLEALEYVRETSERLFDYTQNRILDNDVRAMLEGVLVDLRVADEVITKVRGEEG